MAVWQAYLNVVNSFQGLEMETRAAQGIMMSNSAVSQDRFKFCLGVLDGQIDEDKDEDFKKEKPDNVADMLDADRELSAYFRYWTRIDKLMRRMGFYTTAKMDMGHL